MGYGRRWMAETVFSFYKRLFGEYMAARSFPAMVQEVVLKASLINLFMGNVLNNVTFISV